MAMGKNILFYGAFEQVVRRLSRMQRRHLAEFLHLGRVEIAHANGANFSCPMQFAHGFRNFRERGMRIRPTHLVEIDDVCLQPAQQIVGFFDDLCLAGVAKRLSVFPVEPPLSGDEPRLRRAPTASAFPTISSERPKP
jgi:hypothetical protein